MTASGTIEPTSGAGGGVGDGLEVSGAADELARSGAGEGVPTAATVVAAGGAPVDPHPASATEATTPSQNARDVFALSRACDTMVGPPSLALTIIRTTPRRGVG